MGEFTFSTNSCIFGCRTIMYMHFQLKKDILRRMQVGRFYILCDSCIFSLEKIRWDVHMLGDFTFCVVHVFSADIRACETCTGWDILHLYYSCIFSCRKMMCGVNMLGDFTSCTIHVFSAVERSCETWTGWEILHFVLFMYFQL